MSKFNFKVLPTGGMNLILDENNRVFGCFSCSWSGRDLKWTMRVYSFNGTSFDQMGEDIHSELDNSELVKIWEKRFFQI